MDLKIEMINVPILESRYKFLSWILHQKWNKSNSSKMQTLNFDQMLKGYNKDKEAWITILKVKFKPKQHNMLCYIQNMMNFKVKTPI